MVTFEDIKKANESVKNIVIEKLNKKTGEVTSKEYTEVNQRIKVFRMLYPNGCISTEILFHENGVILTKTSAFDEEGRLLGTGMAQEKEGSTFINTTSYVENAETSSIGRCLGTLGIGIDTSVASFEEVKNAMLNQEKKKSVELISNSVWKDLNKAYNKEQIKEMYKELGITKGSDIPMEYAKAKIDAFLKDNSNMPVKEFY